MTNIVQTKATARELTQAAATSAAWGEQIEKLHQQFLQSGADSLRHALDAGDRLQAAFDHPDRRSLFPRWSDWLAQFAPHISQRTDNYYRELASKRAEVEAYIQQVLAGNESATLRGAIAYLAESKEQAKTADMPPWDEFAELLNQVGRVRKVQGDRLLLEPPAWAERHVTGLPKVYNSLGDLWQAWKESGETWIQQVAEAKAIAESQIGGSMPSQGCDTSPDDKTPTVPPQGVATGQDDSDPSTPAAMVDYAGQAIEIGSEVIYRLDDGDEIGIVRDFDDCSVVVFWSIEGECHHPPEALLVCSDSQPVANEVAITPEVVSQPAQPRSGREFKLFEDLPPRHYSVIYADPPWQYRDKAQAGNRGASFKYDCLDINALMQLPVKQIAADDCLLAMWWVPPMPLEALQLVEAWGFEFKTMKGFTWHKTTVHGKDHFGMGNYTRANSEDCLFAVKGKPKRQSAGVRQIITAQVQEHSRKPDAVRDALTELMGDVPRIELFARQHATGWDVWGNEAPETVDTPSQVVPF